MEKKTLKEIIKKLKATTLAGLTLTSFSACKDNNVEKEKFKSDNYKTEDIMDEKTVEMYDDETLESKTQEQNQTIDNDNSNTNTPENNSNTNTTGNNSNGNQQTTGNNSNGNQTTGNNSNENQQTTENNETPKTTTANQSQNEPTQTTVANQTTQKQTTTKKTTQAQTTQTTAAQQQTQQQTQKQTTTTKEYTKYDLYDSDTTVAAMAFEKLSEDLRKELFNSYMVSDELYGMTAGREQSKIILAALNYYYNGGINPEVLAQDETLKKLSREDFLKYSINLDLPQEQRLYGTKVDFNKYVLDDNFANNIESITNKYYDWANGNTEALTTQIYSYFENHNYQCLENVNNYAEFYYMCKILNEIEYENDDSVDRQTLYDNIIGPIYDSYEPYKGYSYSR